MKANKIACFMIIIIAVAWLQGCVKENDGGSGAGSGSSPDILMDHPLYSTYNFGQGDGVVDIGIQPIAVPIGVTGVLLSRDNILKRAADRQGVELRFHAFLKGSDLNYYLERGDLEAGMGGDMPAITIAAVSDVLVTSLAKQGYTSFVSKGHLLIRDMRGKQIGYPYGSNAHYSLLQTLSSAGLRETDVDLIKLNVNEMAEALADGRIDMFVAWEPVPTVALDRYNDFTVIHRSLATSYLYFSGIFAKRNEELVRQIVAAQVRSMRWVNADRKNLIKACRWKLEREKELTGKEPVIPEDETARLYKKGFLGIRRVPLIPEEDLLENGRLYREFHFLKNLGKIPDAGDWRRVRRSFNNSIIKEVVSHSEKYGLDEFSYRSDGSRDE